MRILATQCIAGSTGVFQDFKCLNFETVKFLCFFDFCDMFVIF